MPSNPIDRMREAFYLWAFRVMYASLHGETSPTIRFIRALTESNDEVSDEQVVGWARSLAELRALAREQDKTPLADRLSRIDYWHRVGSIIREHTGRKIVMHAWELDALAKSADEVDVETGFATQGADHA